MIVLFLIAAISLTLGILFLTNKELLKELENLLNKSVVIVTTGKDRYNKIIGIFLIIFSCILFIIFTSIK